MDERCKERMRGEETVNNEDNGGEIEGSTRSLIGKGSLEIVEWGGEE